MAWVLLSHKERGLFTVLSWFEPTNAWFSWTSWQSGSHSIGHSPEVPDTWAEASAQTTLHWNVSLEHCARHLGLVSPCLAWVPRQAAGHLLTTLAACLGQLLEWWCMTLFLVEELYQDFIKAVWAQWDCVSALACVWTLSRKIVIIVLFQQNNMSHLKNHVNKVMICIISIVLKFVAVLDVKSPIDQA